MNDFHRLSALALDQLLAFFETAYPEADAELGEDVLIVILPNGKQYLINKHGVTHQIWVASPFTGAHHFAYTSGQWLCTRTNRELHSLIQEERTSYVS